MQPHDSRFVTEIEMRSYVDWSATQPFMEALAMHDRLPLLKSAAILHLLFEECYYTSQFPVDGLLVFPNGTFVPRHSDYLPEAYKKVVPTEQLSQFDQLYSPAVAERIDQVVKPLRHLNLLPEELAYVKSVLSLSRLNRMNAGSGMDSEKMRAELLRWRDRLTKALFQFYASINYRGTAERFGNIVLVAGGVISSAASAEEVYQVMRIFQTVQHDATAELLLGP
ncbi:Nuclear hormone receptor family member nhr-19 [Aphelenchoides avenae]|nr:Nuclear hormone receptor family member nhr-19 [Aphelenchus avenae]